jgi:small-conductance mechanosensitive channel
MVSTSVTQPGLAPDGDVPLHETQSGEVKTAGVLAGRARLVAYSIADQAFAVGGMFLANVALARARSKEEYGAFALCYSVYTFLAGLHNAIILEPFTVFGSGRYHQKFQSYARLMRRRNAALCAGLSVVLLFVWLMLRWIAPQFALPVFLGMAITSGVLMTGTFIRRAFYIERRPDLAAGFSISFVIALGILLALAIRNHWLTGFTTFTIAALGWSDYYLDVFLVTNKRIMKVEQAGLFNRVVAELELENIQDITSSVIGPLRTLLDFGDLSIQTASEVNKIQPKDIPHPVRVRRRIMELCTAKKNHPHP